MLAKKVGNAEFFNIEQILKKVLEAKLRELSKMIEADIRRELEKTIRGSIPRGERRNPTGRGGDTGFGDAQVKTKVKIDYSDHQGNPRLEIKATVIDGSGNPHKIWHELNKGTENRTQDRTVVFRKRRDNRTKRGFGKIEQSDNFTGYVSDDFTGRRAGRNQNTDRFRSPFVTLSAGRTIGGITARDWYRNLKAYLNNKYSPYKDLIPKDFFVFVTIE